MTQNTTHNTQTMPSRVQEKHNALSSFIGNKKRPQVVNTPPNILDAVDDVFGKWQWADVYPDLLCDATLRGPIEACGWDALSGLWPENAYANPPYDTLRKHMERGAFQHFSCQSEVIMLCPARPRRDWWCAAPLGAHIAWLKPVAFPGYYDKHGKPTTNPENMVAIGWLQNPTHIERFYLAFRALSNHIAVWK